MGCIRKTTLSLKEMIKLVETKQLPGNNNLTKKKRLFVLKWLFLFIFFVKGFLQQIDDSELIMLISYNTMQLSNDGFPL